MHLEEGRNEPDKTCSPDDFARDPLQLAESLAKEYALLSDAYEAPGGTRDQLNLHLERSYRLGFFYYQNLDEYRAFQAHEYFRDLRQKPNEHNIMRSVLKFTMQAKRNKQRLYRLYKRAPVFEYLYAKGVIPDDVAAFLKKRGGIDYIYDQLCKSEKLRREEFLAEHESDGVDNCCDEQPDVDEDAEQPTSENGGISGNAIVISAEPPADDQGALPLPALQRAMKDQPDEVKQEYATIIRPKRRVDLTTDLVVTFFPHEILEILDSGGGEMTFIVMPRDERGWVHVSGTIKRLFPRSS